MTSYQQLLSWSELLAVKPFFVFHSAGSTLELSGHGYHRLSVTMSWRCCIFAQHIITISIIRRLCLKTSSCWDISPADDRVSPAYVTVGSFVIRVTYLLVQILSMPRNTLFLSDYPFSSITFNSFYAWGEVQWPKNFPIFLAREHSTQLYKSIGFTHKRQLCLMTSLFAVICHLSDTYYL